MAPSPKVRTYDLQPEMSAAEVTEHLVAAIRSGDYDLIVVNYANPDMVGHTGVLEAAIKAVEAVDRGLGEVLAAVEDVGGAMIVTADHGNCEVMIDPVTGGPHTAHTLNPVPVILVGGPAGATAARRAARRPGADAARAHGHRAAAGDERAEPDRSPMTLDSGSALLLARSGLAALPAAAPRPTPRDASRRRARRVGGGGAAHAAAERGRRWRGRSRRLRGGVAALRAGRCGAARANAALADGSRCAALEVIAPAGGDGGDEPRPAAPRGRCTRRGRSAAARAAAMMRAADAGAARPRRGRSPAQVAALRAAREVRATEGEAALAAALRPARRRAGGARGRRWRRRCRRAGEAESRR